MNKVAIAQVDPCVGDIDGNTELVLEYISRARDTAGADTVIFPELVLTGYPPEDLLLRPHFHVQVEQALQRVVDEAQGINVIIGYPSAGGTRLFNACSFIRDREIVTTYHKRNLPNYGVFDEKRYFSEGEELNLVETPDFKVALSVCEDLWTEDHAREAAQAGAELLININASPYHTDKATVREELLRRRAVEHNIAIIYVNLVGGQDELVFDGGSLVADGRGEFVFKAPQFEQGLYLVDLERPRGRLVLEAGSPQSPPLGFNESVYRALTLGVKDYVSKNGFKGAVIGLSGGIDSALTLAVAVDALGPENVEVLLMPSRYTADMSVEDAQDMAGRLGVACHIVSIEKPFSAFSEILAPIFKDLPVDTTEENIQARCRGLLLMAVSNKTGKLVLTTGNKSEMAVGYATLYGDMAGGFAPLKDVPKILVYELSRWRNRDEEIIPQRIIDRPPTAELRFDQKDEDSLPGYDVLDPILEKYIELDRTPAEIIADGYDRDTVYQVVRMVDKNEYKRRQAAPGVRITERAFGRDRRYPITSRYTE
ncbi:MAG: NAD+ synthase [Gammaproteobacteria bacterium]|nr:NAD+ synthase [Gammaproteobacteria bacterium]